MVLQSAEAQGDLPQTLQLSMKLEPELRGRRPCEVDRPIRNRVMRPLQQRRAVIDEDAIQLSSLGIAALLEMIQRHFVQRASDEHGISDVAARIDTRKAL
ncbi:MAG TPA: hypothetical protein VN705_18435 [Steroidobacteraceae bacterium]|jgi:hypothetical protein|nr:hypothetical protein [Steroidobacteraceae bacterium]